MYSYNFEIFKSPCTIMLDASTKEFADELVAFIYDNAKRLEYSYGFFKSDSELSLINNRSNNRIVISDELRGLLKLSEFYFQKTEGAFDIAYAGTMQSSYTSSSLQEYQERVSSLEKYANFSQFTLEGNILQFSNALTKIDLGGLVKEYAVDQSILILKAYNIENALVNFGGDISVMGTYQSQQWNIGIQDPNNSSLNIEKISMSENSLCTSGHSRKFYTIENQKISHIISQDEQQYNQVSILAPTAVDAGVWSTALLINSKLQLPSHVRLITVK